METKKIDTIEMFAEANTNIGLLGYDAVANKVGRVPISVVQKKTPYCGCRWKLAGSSPEGEPFGDLDMLAQLPSILGLGGYLVQNNHSRKKLSAETHFKLESGGEAKLDGSMGHYQWGWGVPFYYAQWKDETYQYEAVSTSPMPGRYNYKIPIASIAASGASALDRTNSVLVSYCNRTEQYRGGNNVADNDAAWNTLLGKPVTNVASNKLQQYAEKNGDRWGATMFPVIFVIGVLTRIIFHNRNIQAGYNADLTADGLRQGGLGIGVDNVNSSFGNQYGTVDIDALADKGDATGVYSVDVTDSDGTVKLTIKNIPCFFGLKNFYKYLYEMLHGCNITYNADKTVNVFAQRVWDKTAVVTDSTSGMRQLGTIPAADASSWQNGTRMSLERMLMFPTEFGGSVSTYYCDGFFHPTLNSGLRGLLALGTANYGGYAGVGCLNGDNAPGNARVNNGAALNDTLTSRRGMSLPHRENTSKGGGETRSRSVSVIPAVQVLQTQCLRIISPRPRPRPRNLYSP